MSEVVVGVVGVVVVVVVVDEVVVVDGDGVTMKLAVELPATAPVSSRASATTT